MPREKNLTLSFIATLPLQTTKAQEKKLLVMSDCARQLYNACLGEALKRFNRLKHTADYQETIRLPKTGERKKQRTERFKELNKEHGFTDYSLQSFAVETKNRSKFIGEHLGSHVCQKIGQRAFRAVQKVSFGQARQVHFKPKGSLFSFEGKNNATFLRYTNGYITFGRYLTVKCRINPKDEWMNHALNQRVKYCRIVQKEINGKIRFYVQLVLEGTPLPKVRMGNEVSAVDIGPSTIAFVSDTKAHLKEFGEGIVQKDKEKRMLQRKMDRQRRANNRDNFRADGTFKRSRRKWNDSKGYLKIKRQVAELERKIAATRKTLHGQLANEIIASASVVKLEKLSYKSFQKLYGRSVGRKAPSLFVDILNRKLVAQGGCLQEISTYRTRLSQTCLCGRIHKKKLSERWHRCECGIQSQRDLFSAYLAKYVSETNELDFEKANIEWNEGKILLDFCINDLRMKKKERKLIATFGI